MAVVQISRIQQRRGRKNSSTGFPQLASGEFGWAIDTQQLYIGNGAVSEGAPYVGNTEILTEHSNLLEFIGLYQYKRNDLSIQTGISPSSPIRRSFQDRFDDYVSVRAFGARGDGLTDDTSAIQRAIDQLFINPGNKTVGSRVVLYFEPGTYVVSDEIRVPPYAHLVGAGMDSTIINLLAPVDPNTFLMRFVDSDSVPGTYTSFDSMNYDQRPQYITLERMTLTTTGVGSVLSLDNADTCFFDQVKFVGTFENGRNPVTPDYLYVFTAQAGIYSRGVSGVHLPQHIEFHNCIFNKTGYGVFSDTDSDTLVFQNCRFFQLFDGINLGGGINGAVNTKIDGSHFDLIDRYGIYIKKGYGNTSSNNKFMLVGNDNQGYENPFYPIVKFDTGNNQSINDYFERNRKLKDQGISGLVPYIASIESNSMVVDSIGFTRTLDVTPSIPLEFLRLPVYKSSTFYIDYVINKTTSGSAIRTGTMHITIDHTNGLSTLQDDFDYIGSSTVENIKFSVTMEDIDGNAIYDTIVIMISNPTGNGTGTMNYTYRTLTK